MSGVQGPCNTKTPAPSPCAQCFHPGEEVSRLYRALPRDTDRYRSPRTKGWLHEIKFDGYRTQLHLHRAKPKAFTRRGNDWSKRFDHLLSELVMLPTRECIIDGEAVIQNERGLTDFGALQDALAKGGSDRIVFFAFDLLYLDGHDLRRRPLVEQKGLLAELLGHRKRLHFSTHQEGSGTTMFKNACKIGLEGIVSKRADGLYVSGRSNAWAKVTCRKRERFSSPGSPTTSGSSKASISLDEMTSATPERSKLALRSNPSNSQRKKAKGLATRTSPLSTRVSKPKGRWLKPEILVDVEYRTLTGEGKPRHTSFKGIREGL